MSELFPQHFLATISRLTLAINAAPQGVRAGNHLGPQAGQSLEFRDFQPYAPGDDLRRVDWNLYARTRDLVVRQFERPTAVPVFTLIDNSRSMHADSPSRYATAARIAAAIAFAAVAAGNTAHTFVAGSDDITRLKPASDRRGLTAVLSDLSKASDSSRASIAAAISSAARAASAIGRGVFFVVSDCFEPSGIEALLDSLRQVPGRPVIVQIIQPWDVDPALSGTLRLSDSESEETLQVNIDAVVRNRYVSAYRRYFDAFAQGLAARGARHITIDASTDAMAQLAPLFPAGRLAV